MIPPENQSSLPKAPLTKELSPQAAEGFYYIL